MSYHTAYPSKIVQLLFAICFSFLHMCTNNCIHLIVNSLFFYLSWDLSWCRVSFWKGDLQFSNCLKIQFVKVFAQ